MNAIQRKSTPAAATDGGAKEKNLRLHITTTSRFCQTLRGITAWTAVIGMLGTVGGMEQGTFPFLPGCFWLAVLLVMLDWGSKPWQTGGRKD